MDFLGFIALYYFLDIEGDRAIKRKSLRECMRTFEKHQGRGI